MPRELPDFICSHIPMEIVFSTKWEKSEELKRELFSVRGDSCTHVFT
jgi:hypothetical protein